MAEETNTEVVETETVDNPETTEADKTFTQDELDHIVQERVKRAVAKAQKDAEDKIKQAQSEGERLAKLTKDEQVVNSVSLRRAMESLKPDEREVVDLKVAGGFTFREISEMVEKPMGTVTWLYNNAIKRLRRCRL